MGGESVTKFEEDRIMEFWTEIEHHALPSLIECANKYYLLNLSLNDLDLEFSREYGSASFGNGRIRFGTGFIPAFEYRMFKDDPDLQIPPQLSRNMQFQAWWVAAHELSHEIVNMIKHRSMYISQPIIPNALGKFDSTSCAPIRSVLIDLLENQAWWKRGPLEDQYHLAYYDKAFKHGIFFQHIYRTLRRSIVNPKFGIEVGEWKQKSKPKYRMLKRWRSSQRINIHGPRLR